MENVNLTLITSGIFGVVMFAYWIGAFFILYHLIRFGVGASPKKMSVIFLGGSLFLSIIVVLLFGQLNILHI